ncbi:MAG: exodeoxyribonuclease V subunit alpha [Methylococcaceae bacterium]|nr:exodeoxyribonuclease V subunit alpha [Methylococcaceae bacterium]
MNAEQQYSRLDIAFSRFLSQRTSFDKKQKIDFEVLCAELSYQQSQGHSCIYVDASAQKQILASGLASEHDLSPLVLEQNRLYLYRYWCYENRLALAIQKQLARTYSNKDLELLLSRYFIKLIDETDWQKEAAVKAISLAFCMISGGPGTGKTTTVVKILALLQELALKQGAPLHIALAAPTGKAAMRLQESIGSSKNTLPCSETIKNLIPETVTTIHRLLGSRPPSPYFKHDSAHPLAYDLVVIDEASMVDLALMSKLVDALKPESRFILLGDKDQLASVESGAVLADLTAALPEHTVELKKSYRFHGDIKALSEAVNHQLIDDAWKILEKNSSEVALLEQDLIDFATKQYTPYLDEINNSGDFSTILTSFSQFQVLCSNRLGTYGVVEINKRIEELLARQNKIQITGQWYVGRPIMVIQNNVSMQLYNGDIGICLYDSQKDKNAVFFLRSDGSIKKILPSRVPAHETVFAMTIHKSQGSEFDECLCVLADKINPVLTKELIYTAITRAKKRLKILSSYSIFSQTLQQKVVRSGGLLEKLTGK